MQHLYENQLPRLSRMRYKFETFPSRFEPNVPTFAYVRVSTNGQTTDNQIGEIHAAGFEVQVRRVVSETVSGSLAAEEREGFRKLLERMEESDILVVTKMDRLGRNAMDVRVTVELLAEMGIKVPAWHWAVLT